MTQAILLGAGRSSRMDSERGDGPKWMLEVAGQSLAQHLVNALHLCEVIDITLARGVLGGAVHTPSVAYFEVLNSRNMLETLYAVRSAVRDDVVVMYCDLLVEPRLVSAALNAQGSAAIVVDRCWRSLFAFRADDPLSIAESCTIEGGFIREIGQPLQTGEVPDAQYIGMMRFSRTAFQQLMTLYETLSQEYTGKPWRNAKTFEGAFMTDFLQECVERGIPLTAIQVDGGWLEFDTPRDLAVARILLATPRPDVFRFDTLQLQPSVISSGGVAVRKTATSNEVLLVGTGKPGAWRVPKGMLKPGETVRVAACREVAEEAGVPVQIEDTAGVEEWTYVYAGRQWLERCYFFRLSAIADAEPRPDAEHAVAAWVPAAIARQGMMYDTERSVLERVLAQVP